MKGSAKRSGLKVVLVFALAGPPSGGIAGGLALFFMGLPLDRAHPQWDTLLLLPVAAVVAYIPGIIPAVLTGLSAATLLKHVESDREWIATVTAAGAVWSGLILLVVLPTMWIPAVGAIASLVCSLACRRFRPVADSADNIPE